MTKERGKDGRKNRRNNFNNYISGFVFVYVSIIPNDGTKTKIDGTTHKNCYYDDEGREFCVDEYTTNEPDIDPYVRW